MSTHAKPTSSMTCDEAAAATPTNPFALVAEYLREFLCALWFVGAKPHPVNAYLSNEYGDGVLDIAARTLGAADCTTALLHLEQAANMASAPIGDENPHGLPSPAASERHHMHLAARVALTLTREAMRQPHSQQPAAPRVNWHQPPESEELLVFTLEETQGKDIDAQTTPALLKPLELDLPNLDFLENHA